VFNLARSRRIGGGFAILIVLTGLLIVAGNSGSSTADHSQAVTRSWGIEVSASISPTSLTTSQVVHLHAGIRNLRPIQLVLREPYCRALLPVMWDVKRRIVWHSSSLCGMLSSPPLVDLSPGQERAEDDCFGIVLETQSCGAIPYRLLQPGTYSIGGTFYEQALPELTFRVVKDNLFDTFQAGHLATSVDGQYVRHNALGTDLLATTEISSLHDTGADVMVLQVDITNTGGVTRNVTVGTCDYPLQVVTHSDALDGSVALGHLLDHPWHEPCDHSFVGSTQILLPGQTLSNRMCFYARDHPAIGYLCAPLYEHSVERMGIQDYGFALPEFTVAVNY
jgi:hypothetical protein